jgi:FkbM family methyltransferase
MTLFTDLRDYMFYKGYQIFGRNSFSQAGEDAVIDYLLWQINHLKPSYLELGVCHAWDGSNTYKFYLRGGRGVLVEADVSQILGIKKRRRHDKVLNVGVSYTGEKVADFYVFEEKSANTFDKAEAEQRVLRSGNKLKEVVKVSLRSINEIIAENFVTYPDILSIDIEGLDFEVLNSLDFSRFPIPIICAETCLFSTNHIKEKDSRIQDFLATKGYFLYADTYLNSIFINENWFNSVRR